MQWEMKIRIVMMNKDLNPDRAKPWKIRHNEMLDREVVALFWKGIISIQ
jgi:hypothetical protein